MPFQPTVRSRRPRVARLVVLASAFAFVAGACSSGGTQPPGSSAGATPGGSDAAACPTIPPPEGNVEGWGPPPTTPTVVPILITAPVVCGPNRLLFSFVDASNVPVAAPDRTASLALYELRGDPSKPIATVDGTFVWAIEDARGIYVANVSIPSAGRYGAEFRTAAPGGPEETIRMTFDVQPTSTVVKVGDRAPASETPTLADVGGDVRHISTDPNPDPRLYETSVDEALAAHEPFVLVFATPKFCQTAQCGPTLERIKAFVDRYPTVTFINVEPYELELEGDSLEADLGPEGQLQPVPVVSEWGLVNEPIVFVVDRQGVVQAVFELIFGDDELTAALDEVK